MRSRVDPERIAHGPGAVDDPELCRELIARRVTLDLCPTSNVQAGIVPSIAAHPLARLHRAGVPVTLSTDDTTVSDITLSEEYRRAVEAIGLTLPELWAIDRHALDVAFADEAAPGAAPGGVRRVGRDSSRAGGAARSTWRRASLSSSSGRQSLQGRGELAGIGGDRGRLVGRGQRLDLGRGSSPRSA